jgi:arylsulfatase
MKLVWDTLNPARRWELYDLAADRTELHDLATQQPELVKELAAAYARWAKATGRRIPTEPPPGKAKKKQEAKQ